MKKKKNIIIILLVIVFILMMALAILVLWNKCKKNFENTPLTSEVMEEKYKDLLNNVFLITYILEGDVKTGDGVLIVDDNENESYYAVTDYLLKDIHDISDITNLIENNLTPEGAIRTRKYMDSSYANKYMVNNNTLYVRKNNNPCDLVNDEIDISKTTYSDEKKYIVYNNIEYLGFLDENNVLKAPMPWFTCIEEFGNIGLEQDDVYTSK